ncbi:rho guanine nucleotide exchange factor 19 [Alosa sapidissima]|uniref:rho guanine nucleotide exchange factor 19 n=1 Tax=Alosa sapidissima TaxID=34773 RepID=UPI001C08C219|nr:rho guanine nucleotide exchange factor 19 [Alosa sapidissima]
MDQLSYQNLHKEHHGRTGISTCNEETDAEVTPAGIAEARGLHVKKGESNMIGAALRSLAVSPTWSLKEGALFFTPHQLFTITDKTSDKSQDVSSHQLDNKEGDCDFTRDMDKFSDGYFETKYFHNLPLYQEYLVVSVKAGLQRVQQAGLANLVVSQCLPGLQSPESYRLATPSPSPTRVLRDKSTYSLWQDLPIVQEQGLLKVLTATQVRQQEVMFELLTSEASYLKSLRVAVDHFQCSEELRHTLSSAEHRILFSSLRSVCGVSQRFLIDLESHFLDNVVMTQFGDIVFRHRVELHQVYVPYVTNMMYQETLISELTQENHRFVSVLLSLEKQPQCQRQTLKSFLVLPFQRITRLKLILQAILKLTDPEALSFGPLTEAISAIHEIVNKCNRNVLLMKQTEELVRFEKLVDFGQIKAIPLITHGRLLIHKGRLRQLKTAVRGRPTVGSVVSFSEVYMHLFSDLLLLSAQKEGRFCVQDYALFPHNVHTEDLKTDVLGLPAESFLLRLTPNHTGAATALILVASTRNEKDVWVNALNGQT